MLSYIFNVMRDVKREYTETNVTETRVGKVIHLPADSMVNVRVDTEGLTEGVSLAIKFEEPNGNGFREIGSFPVPDAAHGILFAKFTEYVRYTLIIDGENPNLNVKMSF